MKSFGQAIPDSPHAVSASMPKWDDVVAYEEGKPQALAALSIGYPRFLLNPFVKQAMQLAQQELQCANRCFLYPTVQSAKRAQQYISPTDASVKNWRGIYAVTFPEVLYRRAMDFWQHTGLGISSRRAEALLAHPAATHASEPAPSADEIRMRIAGLAGVPKDHVWLLPTGMAAVDLAHQALLHYRPQLPTAQFGFPYIDSLKVQQKMGQGAQFFASVSESSLQQLAAWLSTNECAGIFCEAPSNPLMQSLNALELAAIARKKSVPIVCDDSIGCFYNLDLSRFADIGVASLTKYFCGRGDVMGGALVLYPHSAHAKALHQSIARIYENTLFDGDANILAAASRDFEQRMTRVNETTARVAHWLKQHPKVQHVYHPIYENRDHYEQLLHIRGGYGGMLSFILQEGAAQRCYDALEINKGPSFGMNETLCCPYTLLAHYHELPWAAECGVPSQLLRLSLGLEDVDDVIAKLARALNQA